MTRGALLDANLLCLLVVGRLDQSSIATHPRLRAFDGEDFVVLGSILDHIGDPVLCPHVLAETSNLLGYRQNPAQRSRWMQSLADLIRIGSERPEPSAPATFGAAYLRLGLTDAILLRLASDRDLVLVSDDLHLCLEAERQGAKSVNFNYLRDGALRVDQL